MSEIEVPAEWSGVEQLLAFAGAVERELDLSEEQAYLLRMVAEEIATNIVKYGYAGEPGVIRLGCGLDGGAMVVTIRDRGRPFDPRETPEPDLGGGVDERQVGGLGIFFVREFADSLSYEHDRASGWNELRVTKARREKAFAERLGSVALLGRLGAEDLARLAERATERRLAAGEVLFYEGDVGRACYIILSGALEVLAALGGEQLRLEVRQAGQIIGEMALIDHSPRSATIRAVSDSLLAELDEQGFYALMHADPEVALELLRGGTARLRRTSREMISSLESKNAELSRAYQDLKAAQSELIKLERIEEELSVARRIQQLFLPRGLPAPEGWEVAAFSRGAQAVGGDFFDYIELPGGHVGLVVADVAGKGVPAALFVALARSLLRAASQSIAQLRGPAAGLDDLMVQSIELTNTYIVREHGESNMFITLFYGVLDPATGRLRYANAGHNPPMHIARGGQVSELELGCLPVGVIEEQGLRIEEAEIGRGETLVGFSDGITEAMNRRHEMFGEERLMATLRGCAGAGAEATVAAVVRAVEAFVDGAPQSDDITVFVFHRVA